MDTLRVKEEDLCISCTLCCNGHLKTTKGALLSYIPLEERETHLFPQENISIRDITLSRGNEKTHAYDFSKGCAHLSKHKTGECGIYETRPKTCRTFNCKVLEGYTTGTYTHKEALSLIEDVKKGNRNIWRTHFMGHKLNSNPPTNHKQHLVYDNFLTEDECKHIGYTLTRDESKILSIPNTQDTGYKGLTAQHTVYNLLNHPDIRPLNLPKRIFNLDIFRNAHELYIQCWGNILKFGDDLHTHIHGDVEDASKNDFYAFNVWIDGHQPSYTHYEDTGKTLNVRGEGHLVGSLVEHGVRTNISKTPRISLAMDIHFSPPEDEGDLTLIEKEIRFKKVHRNRV